MNSIRNRVWPKVLAALLCIICVAIAAAFALRYAVGAWSDSDETLLYTSAAQSDRRDAINLFFLKKNESNLTYLGRQRLENLQEEFAAGSTNFFYRVLDQSGTVLGGNETGQDLRGRTRSVQDDLFTAGDSNLELESYSDTADDTEASFDDNPVWSWDSDLISGAFTESTGGELNQYVLEYGVATDLTAQDGIHSESVRMAELKNGVLTSLIVAGILLTAALAAFCYLMAAAGHTPEGIALVGVGRWPVDVLVVLTLMGFIFAAWLVSSTTFSSLDVSRATGLAVLVFFAGIAAGLAALGVALCYAFAAQCKARALWSSLLIVKFFRRIGRTLSGVRLFWKATLGAAAFLLFYFLFGVLAAQDGSFVLLDFAIAVGALLALLWWLRGWRAVEQGTAALADGDLNHKISTEKLPADLKRHAQQLNDVGAGMEKAVAERMKSDRFRTELITNVSHDLKTPLTSIINYVDLLKKLDLSDETAKEYIDVLDRKSQRLKTLTEDLVEASKAATGVLTVEAARLDLCQLSEQAIGEYEEKFKLARLTVVPVLPEGGVTVLADGRHVWRILDNLLGNCVKYAMPGTRVYLTVEKGQDIITLSVKNISADALNVDASELMERFVRGDSSRTTEGSGLGLSIAQSLARLQAAQFHIEIDGDLFKAMVVFPLPE